MQLAATLSESTKNLSFVAEYSQTHCLGTWILQGQRSYHTFIIIFGKTKGSAPIITIAEIH